MALRGTGVGRCGTLDNSGVELAAGSPPRTRVKEISELEEIIAVAARPATMAVEARKPKLVWVMFASLCLVGIDEHFAALLSRAAAPAPAQRDAKAYDKNAGQEQKRRIPA